MGLGLRIPETHDSLGWLVTPAAATINWFRPGLDGRRRMSCVWAASFADQWLMGTKDLVDEC